ncbi:MAG: riboflavin synthase [Candidatus Omnitrophica bacterium]|nr:riboflavin synthase [Candidatus Omnitrophota bacterium]
MFSGIIEETGKIKSKSARAGIWTVEIEAQKILEGTKKGDSISVNGVCLTAEKLTGKTFAASLSRQTMEETSFGGIKTGVFVNMERALKMGDRIGGHLLTGHIDFKTPLKSFYKEGGDSVIMGFAVPPAFRKYVVQRGSIGVDGLSLTVAGLENGGVQIFLIPHTLENTNLKYRKPGDMLNIEVDMTAKQIEKILSSREEEASRTDWDGE